MSATPRDFTTTPLTIDEEIAYLDTLLCRRGDTAEPVSSPRYTDMMGTLIARKAELCRQRDAAHKRMSHDGEEQWRA